MSNSTTTSLEIVVFKQTIALSICVLCCASFISPVVAEERGTIAERINSGTVGIISGSPDSTSMRVATDLAAVLDDGDNLRVLTVIGRGSVQNITDILYLKGIDIGIVQSDVLSYFKREGVHRGIDQRINYITKLYNEELHLLVGRDINSAQDLAGKKVNFGVRDSGTYLTASTVFDGLKIDVETVSFDHAVALEKVKTGEIAGMVYVEGKPTRLFQSLTAEDGVHFLPVVFTPALLGTYLPSYLSDEDYPGLIPPGNKVDTLAVTAVMAVFNWAPDTERYQKVSRFVEAFFSRFPEFQKAPRHGKWAEVSLTAEVPEWTRFKAAADWLKRNPEPVAVADASSTLIREAFQKFLDEELAAADLQATSEEKDRMFQKFLGWQDGPTETTINMYRPTANGIGESLGTIKAEEGRYGLILTPNLSGLTPGPHGFHAHQHPNCGLKEKDGKMVPGLAAGGHLDPGGTGEHHGPLFNRGHLGDLPVLIVAEDGSATEKILAPRLEVSDLADRSLVIHGAGNDPSRQACGVIK